MLKIVADENIALLPEFFGAHGKLVSLPGRNIAAADVHDADVLLVRSVTRVDQALLENSRVRFVGSCTIGTDHLDTAWLDRQGIHWSAAPGCNANAVVDYVVSCLFALDVPFSKISIGIVGCGAVGSRLSKRLQRMGANVLHCDPFRRGEKYLPLNKVLGEADVICLHTPLTTEGKHPTFHLLNSKNFSLLKPDALLLNAGRGAVVDNKALLQHLEENRNFRAVLDVWENEPDISGALLHKVSIATPHIAGYSVEGKRRGTEMIYDKFCDYFEIKNKTVIEKEDPLVFDARQFSSLKDLVLAVYNPLTDSEDLKHAPKAFDRLRKFYVYRREFSCCRVRRVSKTDRKTLKAIGF